MIRGGFGGTPAASALRESVRQMLYARAGDWIDGEEIEAEGGHEGLRRMRELRDEGMVIQRRPNPLYGGRWQYRLAVDTQVVYQASLWGDDEETW